jgi:hypothetical protein
MNAQEIIAELPKLNPDELCLIAKKLGELLARLSESATFQKNPVSAKYFAQKVTAIRTLDGRRVHVTFLDGFEGEADLGPLIGKGPLYEPLREDKSFHAVVIEHGVPVWPGDFDLSPGTLRAWCEAGRFLDHDEADQWIEEHWILPFTLN